MANSVMIRPPAYAHWSSKSCGRAEYATSCWCEPIRSRRPSTHETTTEDDIMVASDSFAEFLREQLAPLGRLTMRRMFGKTGVFCNGLMLAMVIENTLYFRV